MLKSYRNLWAALVISAATLAPSLAFAWGEEGHSIVAELAQHRLSREAARAVASILGCNVSLASVSSFADDYRSGADGLVAKHPETFNWHFVDIPLGRHTYIENVDCKADPVSGICVIKALEQQRQILTDTTKSRAERALALKMVVHLVGDLHQPLHATDNNDEGGNDLIVQLDGDYYTLHALWDTGLIRARFYDWGAFVDEIEQNWLPKQNETAVAAGTPVDWALEAHALAESVAYTFPPNLRLKTKGKDGKDDKDNAYYRAATPVVEEQLARAGVRLAKLLNDDLNPTGAALAGSDLCSTSP